MFTPNSKRAALHIGLLSHPGEIFTRVRIEQLFNTDKATAAYVLSKMRQVGEAELLTYTFPPEWRIAGKKNGRPSKQIGLRAWLLQHPGEIFTGRQIRKEYGKEISPYTTRATLAKMVKNGEAIKLGERYNARWMVVDRHRTAKSSAAVLRDRAGLPPLETWVSRL